MNKEVLYARGLILLEEFCIRNKIHKPNIVRIKKDSRYYFLNSCAFYRRKTIQSEQKEYNLPEDYCLAIMVEKCATIGTGGRCWSYPGYVIDRTPYGVLQHELGHHVDLGLAYVRGVYQLSVDLYEKSLEEPLTGYCPGEKGKGQWCSEWFAEMFRLFVTNPQLLMKVRPRTYKELINKFKPAEDRIWREVLEDAPERTILQAEKKIKSIA